MPRRGERGAAAVEAAIIFPVLVLLTFGIIEFSLLLRDYVSLNALVRQGTRTAATLPRYEPTPEGLDLAELVVRDMNAAGNALPQDTYDELWVFQAGENGLPLGATSFSDGACTTNCVIYRVNGAGDFVRASDPGAPFWDWEDQNACPGETDSVGVYLRANHTWITGLFADVSTISDFAVTNFEPIATYSETRPCRPAA